MPPARTRTRAATRRTNKQQQENPESLDVADAEVRIEDLANFDESINWLIYGPSGHGKTTLAGGCPRSTFMSTEKGAVAARLTGSKSGLIRTPTWETVVAGKKLADSKLKKGDWLILDSLTKMQVLMLRWILRMEQERNPRRDLDIPAIQNHQKWQNYFKRFVDSLIDAPYNTIFICTDMNAEDEEMETIVLPDIQGKGYSICNYVRAQMDIVTYYALTSRTEDGGAVRRALFEPYPPYTAPKDRYRVFNGREDVGQDDFGAMAEFVRMLEDAIAA